jgi:subtilase family serine protease
MKTYHSFIRSNFIFSHLRIATAGALVTAAVAMAFVAAKTSSSPILGKSDRSHHHPMSVRLAQPERLAQIPAGVVAPRYGLFGCQLGLSVGQCYDPYQMRHAYQIDSLIAAGYDGTGRTIVIVDAFQNPNLVRQVAVYDAFYGLPAINLTQIAPDGLTAFDPSNGDMVGWAEEISLDVEWAHAIAPGAKIVLVLAKSDMDVDIQSALDYAVEHNLGDVISMSFGENESCLDPNILSAEHGSFAAATQEYITLFASSGDEGAALPTCGYPVNYSWVKAASTPANDPLVTGVGGTELHAADYCLTAFGCNPSTNPLPGTYEGEIAWNEGPPFGDLQDFFSSTLSTGGGFSVLFDEQPYQEGTGGLHGGKQRPVPDVAYNAAVLHGVLTYLDIPGIPAGFYRVGGTSAGSPQWAAITAIANQRAGGRLGFLNKAIYQIGKHIGHVNPAHPASFHDITSGTNSAVEFDSSNNPVTIIGFDAGTGWDPTTGTGSPIASGLVAYLVKNVSPSDGQSAVATTPKSHAKSTIPGHKHPH